MKKLTPITITEARTQFPEMLKSLGEDNEQVITKENLPVLVVVSWKRYRALRELLAMLPTENLDAASKKAASGAGRMTSEQIRSKMARAVHEFA